MLTIIILRSTSLNKAKGPSHQIHTATKWASEALRHPTQVCVKVCVSVCVGGGKMKRRRNAFLPELGNLLHKAKSHLLFHVIIYLCYTYNLPRIVSNLCIGMAYSAYIDKLPVY